MNELKQGKYWRRLKLKLLSETARRRNGDLDGPWFFLCLILVEEIKGRPPLFRKHEEDFVGLSVAWSLRNLQSLRIQQAKVNLQWAFENSNRRKYCCTGRIRPHEWIGFSSGFRELVLPGKVLGTHSHDKGFVFDVETGRYDHQSKKA